jgi:hypothetical protein
MEKDIQKEQGDTASNAPLDEKLNNFHGGFWHYKCSSRRVARAALAFVLAVLIFGLGAAFGAWHSFGGHEKLGYRAEGVSMMGFGGDGMMAERGAGGSVIMMKGFGFGVQSLAGISGVISKIDGNNITITDNGNQEKVIVSNSDTRITLNGNQASLPSLKAGQNITAKGEMKDNQLQAAVISVTQ